MKRFFFCIFKNGYISYCKKESYKGGKSGLESEMGDDRKLLEKLIRLNDERLKYFVFKKCINIK